LDKRFFRFARDELIEFCQAINAAFKMSIRRIAQIKATIS
jgi:hypothetical protein